MDNVTSKDGTTIAFDRLGDGPPVVLVSGGSVDRSSNAPSPTSSPASSRSTTTTGAAAAPAATRSRTPMQREIEDIDGRASPRPVARRVCTARRPVRRWRSRPPRRARRSRSSRCGSRRTSSAKPAAAPTRHRLDLPQVRRRGPPRRRRRVLHGEGRRACRPSSSASPAASRGGRPRRPSPTPSPTTPRSWATTASRPRASPRSPSRRWC